MSIANVTGVSNLATTFETQQTNDTASSNTKAEQLQKQLEQIKKNDDLPNDEKETRIANIEKQLAQIE